MARDRTVALAESDAGGRSAPFRAVRRRRLVGARCVATLQGGLPPADAEDVETLRGSILRHLRAMDAEAVPRADGRATGLWWYGGHARPELKRPQTEVEWSRRLAALLAAEGYGVRREVPYPGPGTGRPERCDLVLVLRDGRRAWIEVKGAWKDWWLARGGEAIFRAYLLHPLVPAPSLGKGHTAALDLAKLGRLRREHADAVALVLVTFDTDDAPAEPDLGEFERLAKLGAWDGSRARWDDPHAPARRVDVRVWSRGVA